MAFPSPPAEQYGCRCKGWLVGWIWNCSHHQSVLCWFVFLGFSWQRDVNGNHRQITASTRQHPPDEALRVKVFSSPIWCRCPCFSLRLFLPFLQETTSFSKLSDLQHSAPQKRFQCQIEQYSPNDWLLFRYFFDLLMWPIQRLNMHGAHINMKEDEVAAR